MADGPVFVIVEAPHVLHMHTGEELSPKVSAWCMLPAHLVNDPRALAEVLPPIVQRLTRKFGRMTGCPRRLWRWKARELDTLVELAAEDLDQ